jgi:hypothetical protein
MLSRRKTYAALNAKEPNLRAGVLAARGDAGRAEAALAGLQKLGVAEVRATLQQPWPGARPTDEHDCHPNQCDPFGRSFSDHEQARRWALEILEGQPTFAADGSQIEPLSELYLPVAAAQVAWYLNYHQSGREPEKDLAIEVRVGQDLRTEAGGVPVDVLRFQMEVRRLTEFILSCRDRRDLDGQPVPVCFYDGPLVVSFASPSAAGRRAVYVEAICALIEASERARVPLIGYVADSAASDFLAMLRALGLMSGESRLSDAALMAGTATEWGDRSVAYVCARDDEVLNRYTRRDGSPLSDQIGFCYLRTTAANRPSRLEFPLWLLDDHEQFERVLDIVRAECIIGLGYPYCLETADQTAVLTGRDRQDFLDLVSQFAESHGLDLRPTTKSRSKRRRRQGA